MSKTSRNLAYLVAGTFFMLGIVLYLAPGWASRNFSWSVSPFVAMTMGSWFLGGAFVAWRATVIRAWSVVYPGLLFLGAFGVLQVGVLLFHRSDVRFDELLGGSHFLIVFLVVGAAIHWATQWFSHPDEEAGSYPAPPIALRVITAVFVLFAGYFGLRLLLGISKGGNIWPGTLQPVTARLFGAFYLALAVAVVPLIWSRSIAPILGLLPAAIAGSVLAIIPALFYIEQFDFDRQPGGLIYIGTYVLVPVLATIILLRDRATRNPDPK